MAGSLRDAPRDLIPRLPGHPSTYSFFHVVSLAERFYPDAVPVGSAADPAGERIRFRAFASLAFPPADIVGFDWRELEGKEPRLRITVAFLGLYGSASPLAPHYTEAIIGGDPEQDTLRDFLDLFNHRLTALFYRTWTKYRYHIQLRGRAEDPVSRKVFALGGLHLPRDPNAPRASDAIDWSKLLAYAGLLALNCRSPGVLERIIGHYFEIPVRIEEGIERHVSLDDAQQNRLGLGNGSLSLDWVLGSELVDISGKFRIWLGPLSREQFDLFLPGGSRHTALYKLVRGLLRDGLDFDIWLKLRPGEAEPWSLGDTQAAPLGWSMWLGDADSATTGVPLAPA
jgi:type VI secretion system protein ImpH